MNDNKDTQAAVPLSIQVQILGMPKPVPFVIMPKANNELVLLIRPEDLKGLPSVYIDQFVSKESKEAVAFTKETLADAAEWPPEFAALLPVSLVEVFTLDAKGAEEKYGPGELLDLCKRYLADLHALTQSFAGKGEVCSPCEIGALNRRYIPKLLKHFSTDKDMELYADVVNFFLDGIQPDQLKTPYLSALKAQHIQAVENALKTKGGCSGCRNAELRRIQKKYSDIIINTINFKRSKGEI